MKKHWLILITVFGLFFLYPVLFPSKIDVRVATVTEALIEEYIEDRGITTLPKIHRITMPLDGRIQEIDLEEGQQITAGQIVAKMDDFDLKIQQARLKAKIQAIQARIKVNEYNSIEETAKKESKNIILSMKNAVQAAEKKVEASKAREEYSVWWLEQAEKLYQDKSTALQELKKAKTDQVTARVDYQSDQFNYYAWEAMYTAIKLMPVYIEQYLVRKTLDRAVLMEELKETQIALQQVEQDLTRASVKSLIGGVILKRHVSSEQVLAAGAALLDLGDFRQLQVTADILSREAVRIRPNQKVLVEISPEVVLPGKVHLVKPQGFTKVSSLGVEQQRVEVVVHFDQTTLDQYLTTGTLGLAYRVQTKIITRSKEKALQVPRSSVFLNQNGGWQAFIVENEKLVKKDLQVGLMNDRVVEIISPLQKGNKVVIAPEADLQEGMIVNSLPIATD